jgi:L-alanine-DL-glutamate epimerase-like enolase superfamily enzyme
VRVAAVDTVVVDAKLRNWVFVKVTTDEGIVGWGEASLEWKTRAVVGAVEDLAGLVVGEEPFRIEHLWQAMFRQQFFKGGIVTMSAISGIEQALHDVKAAALGVPLYELLGGRVRDRVRLYDHLGGGDSPIATGERLTTRWEFVELLAKRGCAIVQPDVCHCGGVAELRRIAAMAETAFVGVAPHNPLGPIATAVNLHLALATPNFLIQELMRADVPWRDEVVDAPLEIVDGHLLPPTRPGIGVAVDEAAAAKHPYRQEPEARVFHEDGAVGDW